MAARATRARVLDVDWYRLPLARVIRNSPTLRLMAEAIGRRGTAFGIANSPDAPALHEGYVEGWFSHYTMNGPGGWPQLEVGNDDWKWHLIENGAAPHVARPNQPNFLISSPAHHLLARTLHELGVGSGARYRDTRGRFI